MTDAVPPEQLRVSDIDRKAVQERLHQAHADGLITLDEFDERVAALWTTKTRGELAKLTADLPNSPAPVPPAPAAPVVIAVPKVVVRRQGSGALRVLSTIWLAVSVVNIVIWGLVCLTSGEFVYPWWVWVAAPSGAVLGVIRWMSVNGSNKPTDPPAIRG